MNTKSMLIASMAAALIGPSVPTFNDFPDWGIGSCAKRAAKRQGHKKLAEARKVKRKLKKQSRSR